MSSESAEITFEKPALPDHQEWDSFYVEQGTAIWARHADIETFTETPEDASEYQATGTQPSYQIELNELSDNEYGVTMSKSIGPDSSGVLTDDSRSGLSASAAEKHVLYLLQKYV